MAADEAGAREPTPGGPAAMTEPDIDPGYRGLPNAFLLPHMGSATR